MNSVIKKYFMVLVLLNSVSCFQVIAKEEIIDYNYLLEEEKLARDVYVTLGEKWDLQIFKNIQSSESHHMEMVKSILASKGQQFDLPAETGRFKNPEIQKLYEALIYKGLKSVNNALEVGLTIEEKDIADLEKLIAVTTNQSELQILNALLSASFRHKSAFLRNRNK